MAHEYVVILLHDTQVQSPRSSFQRVSEPVSALQTGDNIGRYAATISSALWREVPQFKIPVKYRSLMGKLRAGL
jgi:hypothetical protein